MRKIITLIAAACLLAFSAAAQTPELEYHDAAQYRLINRGFPASECYNAYTRLPLSIKGKIPSPLWDRSQNSSGIGVRFATDSKTIGVMYKLQTNAHMAHMADTGIKGCDLYIHSNGKWHYVNTLRPANKFDQKGVLHSKADGQMHEYMIYFPLYDGLENFNIGIDKGATIKQPELKSPATGRGKLVFYGTSILHGGCASRTGMCPTNIIQRELDMECYNIGTSGQGKMYPEMAKLLAGMKGVAAFIIDPVPNCTKDMCDSLTYDFVNTIRKAQPGVPIIMVEGPMYPYGNYDTYFKNYLPSKNTEFHKNYLKLKAEDPTALYYVTNEGLTGPEEEGTVDGIHLTDYGFRAYADKLIPVIKTALNANPESNAAPCTVIAHRGCWIKDLIPENSIAGVKMAARYGIWGIELDVRYTKDSVMVIMHDPTINRTMRLKDGYQPIPGKLKVQDLTFEELRTKYILASDNPQYREQIPTLVELLRACKQYNVMPVMHSAVKESYRTAQRMLGDNWVCFMEKDELAAYARSISNCLCLLDPGRDTAPNAVERLKKIGGRCGISTMKYDMLVGDYISTLRDAGFESQSSIFPTPHEIQAIYDRATYILSDFCWFPQPYMSPAHTYKVNNRSIKAGKTLGYKLQAKGYDFAGQTLTLTFKGKVEIVLADGRTYTITHEEFDSQAIGIRMHGIAPTLTVKALEDTQIKALSSCVYTL